jgi:hypothetical protein
LLPESTCPWKAGSASPDDQKPGSAGIWRSIVFLLARSFSVFLGAVPARGRLSPLGGYLPTEGWLWPRKKVLRTFLTAGSVCRPAMSGVRIEPGCSPKAREMFNIPDKTLFKGRLTKCSLQHRLILRGKMPCLSKNRQ